MFSKFFFENRAVYGITSKNVVQPDRPQTTVRRMRVASWTSKATRTYAHVHTQHAPTHPSPRAHTHRNMCFYNEDVVRLLRGMN